MESVWLFLVTLIQFHSFQIKEEECQDRIQISDPGPAVDATYKGLHPWATKAKH